MQNKLSTKKWQKNIVVFDINYCVQKFSAYNFFWVIFCIVSTDTNSASNIAFHEIFCYLKSNSDEADQKKEQLFLKCVLEYHLGSISGLEGFILSKKVKIIVPSTMYRTAVLYMYRRTVVRTVHHNPQTVGIL